SLELTPLGGPSACSKRGCFHCQAKIKIIFVSSSIFDSNDAEFVNKSHPPFRSLTRVAPIVLQIYRLQKQGRDRERAHTDFFTASECTGGANRTRIYAEHADLLGSVSSFGLEFRLGELREKNSCDW